MDFMTIALSAITLGVVVMLGYYLVSTIGNSIPTPTYLNTCYGVNASAPGVCYGLNNYSLYLNDTAAISGIASTKTTVFSGFNLLTISIIVMAAFGIITIFVMS